MKNKILTLGVSALMVVAVVGIIKFVKADSTGNLLPVADGTYRQWVPNVLPLPPATTTPHYTMVDESLCNGDLDYNHTTDIGARDSYLVDISSVPNGAVINSVSITPCASAYLMGIGLPPEPRLAVFYRYNNVNSADVVNYSFPFPITTNIPTLLAPTVFSGLNLVKENNSHLEVGVKLDSGPNGLSLSQIIASVTYTPTSTATGTPPTVTTTFASNIKKFSATLNGQANPNGKATAGWFRYSTVSPGTCNDTFGTKLPLAPVALGAGNNPVSYSTNAVGLSAATTYYYCAIASNADGLGFGQVKYFLTLPYMGF